MWGSRSLDPFIHLFLLFQLKNELARILFEICDLLVLKSMLPHKAAYCILLPIHVNPVSMSLLPWPSMNMQNCGKGNVRFCSGKLENIRKKPSSVGNLALAFCFHAGHNSLGRVVDRWDPKCIYSSTMVCVWTGNRTHHSAGAELRSVVAELEQHTIRSTCDFRETQTISNYLQFCSCYMVLAKYSQVKSIQFLFLYGQSLTQEKSTAQSQSIEILSTEHVYPILHGWLCTNHLPTNPEHFRPKGSVGIPFK